MSCSLPCISNINHAKHHRIESICDSSKDFKSVRRLLQPKLPSLHTFRFVDQKRAPTTTTPSTAIGTTKTTKQKSFSLGNVNRCARLPPLAVEDAKWSLARDIPASSYLTYNKSRNKSKVDKNTNKNQVNKNHSNKNKKFNNKKNVKNNDTNYKVNNNNNYKVNNNNNNKIEDRGWELCNKTYGTLSKYIS